MGSHWKEGVCRYHRSMRIRSFLPALPLLLAAASLPAATPAAVKPAAAAPAPAETGQCLSVEDGWIRLPPAPRPMLAGFGRIASRCASGQVVTAVRSPRFADVSLHETTLVDGVSRMRAIERLPVAAGGAAVLQPGGLHLMLMQPDAVLAEGERVPLVLVLADGSEVPATLTVRKAAP
jgi:copper(I)-binding protein